MWDMCGWSGSMVILVFPPHVHTYGCVNVGELTMGPSP